MPDIDITRSHSLGLNGARDAVEQVARQLETDLGVEYEWDDETLLFSGSGANGQIEVEEDTVQLLIDLSAFLQPMQSRIESEAEQYLDRHLEE